jgi:malonyl-CoA/methylmalonyl-CoA synthetase
MTAGAAASPLLARLGAHPADAVAVTDADGRGARYGELARGASAVSARVSSATGGTKDAVVAFLVEPGIEFVEVLLGIWRSGALAVPLSPAHTRPELAYLVGNASPSVLIAGRTLAHHLLEAAAPGSAPVLVAEDVLAPSAATSAEAPLVAAGGPRADQHALMLYTSGTTGRPKGVRLTHAALAATVRALQEAWRWQPSDRLLHVLPLHHTHGLVVALLGALWAGASLRFQPFAAAEVWDRLADASVFMAVPTIYAKLLEAHRSAPEPVRRRWTEAARAVRLFTSGSAALPAAAFEAFRAATGQSVLERYGMTEIGMALSNPYDGPRVPGAVGRPLPGVEVDIVDDDGWPVSEGQPGELRVRTPQMFAEYHGDPAATAAGFDDDGRFRTGDTGVRDADGVIRLLGRTSIDIIKSGGYKLSALEIEAALLEHPAVAEAAVLGAPDPTWGERVTAFIVARDATLTAEALQSFARDRLAPYKLPRDIRFIAALPRNAMGKVQKQRLRDT